MVGWIKSVKAGGGVQNIPVLRRHSNRKGEHPLKQRACKRGYLRWILASQVARKLGRGLTCAILLPTQFAGGGVEDGEAEEWLPFVEQDLSPSPWGGRGSVGAIG